MPQLDLVVMGASAGGLEALVTVVRNLPKKFHACILIVVHTRNDSTSYLPQILERARQLPVRFAKNGSRIAPGEVMVAPPDFHVLVRGKRIELSRGPRENGFRPAIDPLFRTAARAYGQRVMGVILSGALDDGTYGMKVIQDAGGTTVVQEPSEATIPSMPLSVIKAITPDHILTAAGIGRLIGHSQKPHAAEGAPVMAKPNDPEPQNLDEEMEVADMLERIGPPSGLMCPDCGGALWEIQDGTFLRYRCHVGHQYSPDGLDAGQGSVVEGALWSAVRVLEEHTNLRTRMADRAEDAGLAAVSDGFRRSADETHRQAEAIRVLLFNRNLPAPPPASGPPQRRSATEASSNGRRLKLNSRAAKVNRRATTVDGPAAKSRAPKPGR